MSPIHHSLLLLPYEDLNPCQIKSLILQSLSNIEEVVGSTFDLSISNHEFRKVNDLQLWLITLYNIIRKCLSELDLEGLTTRVLYNRHFSLFTVDEYWQSIYLTSSTKACIRDENIEIIELLPNELTPIILTDSTTLGDDSGLVASHKVSAVGGTFDHFHDGHKTLLTISGFLTSEKLIIGITGDALLKNKKYSEVLESFDTRQKTVEDFFKLVQPSLKLEIYQIQDVCGPTGYIEDIDALIVSAETESGAKFINNFRKEKGMRPLHVHVIDIIGGGSVEDGWSSKLSSTHLRKKEHETKLNT